VPLIEKKHIHYLVLTCIISVFSACKGQNKEAEKMEQETQFTNELKQVLPIATCP
jgi:hypothetical protein